MDLDLNNDLSSRDLKSNTVLPFAIVNRFQHCNETVWMPLNQNALIIRYDAAYGGTMYFRPVVGMRKDWDMTVGKDFHLEWSDPAIKSETMVHISTNNNAYHGAPFLSCGALASGQFIKAESYPSRAYPRDMYRHDGSPDSYKYVYQPGKIAFQMNSNNPLYIVCVIGPSKTSNIATIRNLASLGDATMSEMERSINSKISNVSISSNLAYFDKSVMWALASVDSLTMNVSDRGIYAGLHWFTQYWGRDSFISLQGACLISGDFQLARQFINTMANAQDISYQSKTFGRVPNILKNDDEPNNYETTDGNYVKL